MRALTWLSPRCGNSIAISHNNEAPEHSLICSIATLDESVCAVLLSDGCCCCCSIDCNSCDVSNLVDVRMSAAASSLPDSLMIDAANTLTSASAMCWKEN